MDQKEICSWIDDAGSKSVRSYSKMLINVNYLGPIFHEERHRVPLGISSAEEKICHSITVRLHLKQQLMVYFKVTRSTR